MLKVKRLHLVLILLGQLFPVSLHAAATCSHYASPTGTGNGLSQSSPFKISSFWPLAKPGNTLCLMDGEYKGSDSMITPPAGLSGLSTAPITVRSQNDGKATINAESLRLPVRLSGNNYFILEGFNAHHSNASVVSLSNSNNNIVRRVAAWDAAEGNYKVFGVHSGNNNLIEDCAGWGIARKVFDSSSGGNYTTFRRNWGRWEGSHFMGPKMTYTLAYNHYNMIIENSIGTWSGERMKESYNLLCDSSSTYSQCGQVFTNYRVDQPFAIFSTDRLDAGKIANSKFLANIAYLRSTDKFGSSKLIWVDGIDSYEVADSTAFVEPGSFTNVRAYTLSNLDTNDGVNLRVRNSTGIATAASVFDTNWQKTNVIEGAALNQAFPSGHSLFTSGTGKGATICKCTVDGVLTNQPLWPWPMNQRIIDALKASGRAPLDVTATIESMFGPIPSECKTTGQTGFPAPVSLTISSTTQ